MDCSPPGSSVHGFSGQEYWSGLPFPSPGDLPDSGIEPRSPALHIDALLSEPPEKPLPHINYLLKTLFPNAVILGLGLQLCQDTLQYRRAC